MSAVVELFETSTKKGRGLGKKTLILRENILAALEGVDPPVIVRHIYYLCASAGYVPKTERQGYDPVQRQVLAMRREGIISYDFVTDGSRYAVRPKTWGNLYEFLDQHQQTYRQNWWNEIPEHVEVWCEKDAIRSVLHPVTWDTRVNLYSARGYPSESLAWEAIKDIRETGKDTAYIYHVGDFDPSGWHASTDLAEKLRRFGDREGVTIHFRRLGINHGDINRYGLITRDTKLSDTRTRAFFAKFGWGQPSCELEAMHPNTLRSLVREAIRSHIPEETQHKIELEETAARGALKEFMSSYGGES